MPTGLDRWLAYRDRYVWQLTQTINDDCVQDNPVVLSDEPTKITLELTETEFTKMFSALMTGADLIYPYEAHDITWLLWRAVECHQEPETVTEIIETVRNIMSESGADCAIEEIEQQMALQIQTIDGIDYLVENCCGGATRFFALTQVAIDGTGTPISPVNSGIGIGADSGDNGAWDFGGITGNPQDCYAETATNYLMSRAIEFAHAVIDFASIGLDALTNLDEYVEVAALVSKLLFGTGDIPAIQALTKSAVSDALTDSATVTPLAAAWNYTGRITKGDLREWANNAPWVVDSVPVRMILHEWITDSWLIGISKDLAQLAAECESGNVTPTAPEVAGATWYADFNFLELGVKLGWNNGSSPEGTAEGFFDPETGWYSNTIGDLEKAIAVKYSETLTLVGMRVHLNQPMDGTARVRVIEHPSDTPAYNEAIQHLENPTLVTFTELEMTLPQVEVQNNPSPSDMSDWRIERIELWGVGPAPTNGNVFILS